MKWLDQWISSNRMKQEKKLRENEAKINESVFIESTSTITMMFMLPNLATGYRFYHLAGINRYFCPVRRKIEFRVKGAYTEHNKFFKTCLPI